MKKISEILGCPSPINVREPDDFYQTPAECTVALIAAEGDRLPRRAWDPCCGTGDIAVVLEANGLEVVSTDLVDRGYGKGGVDFLTLDIPLATAIVTNPPFKHAEAMIRHAAKLGIDYVAFLHQPHWLNTQDRGRMVKEVWCPARAYHLLWRPDFKGQERPVQPMNSWVFDRGSMKGTSWRRACCGNRAMSGKRGRRSDGASADLPPSAHCRCITSGSASEEDYRSPLSQPRMALVRRAAHRRPRAPLPEMW
jgi:hypothetical protein